MATVVPAPRDRSQCNFNLCSSKLARGFWATTDPECLVRIPLDPCRGTQHKARLDHGAASKMVRLEPISERAGEIAQDVGPCLAVSHNAATACAR